jgi:hypothetical protein
MNRLITHVAVADLEGTGMPGILVRDAATGLFLRRTAL